MEQRLQKLIAEAGITSRRGAEEIIAAGEVTVNGETIRELGTKADPARDHIKVRGKLINPLLEKRELVYVLLNKPRGYLSSLADDENRPVVTELLPPSLGRLHPVGRLDFNTEGLLILTNDGELTNFITSARNNVAKVYEVKVQGQPADSMIERLRRGLRLEDGTRTAPAEITRTGETEHNTWYEIVLHQGLNNQIRRMFEIIGHTVLKLRRVRIGQVRDDKLYTGAWRRLEPAEVASFKPKRAATKSNSEERERREDRRAAEKRARERAKIERGKAIAKRALAKAAGKSNSSPARASATAKKGSSSKSSAGDNRRRG